jgi:hypothetical protein
MEWNEFSVPSTVWVSHVGAGGKKAGKAKPTFTTHVHMYVYVQYTCSAVQARMYVRTHRAFRPGP